MTHRTTDYDRIAEKYAIARRCHSNRHGDKSSDFISGSLVRGGITLDAGCGSGEDLPLLSALSRELFGIDRSTAMLRLAASFPNHSATLVKGDVCALPFSDRSFDTILARFVLQYVEHPKLAYREFARTICDGGNLILFLPHPSLGGNGADAASPVDVQLFDGTITVTYPIRPLSDYLSPTFRQLFDISSVQDFYLDPDRSLPSAIGVLATRRTEATFHS